MKGAVSPEVADGAGSFPDREKRKRKLDILQNSYFWPKTEAWEQLKLELDSKLWLTKKEKEQILQTTGDVMKYWLSYRNTKTVENLKEEFKEIDVLLINN